VPFWLPKTKPAPEHLLVRVRWIVMRSFKLRLCAASKDPHQRACHHPTTCRGGDAHCCASGLGPGHQRLDPPLRRRFFYNERPVELSTKYFEELGGTRSLRVIHGRDARATAAHCRISQ